jgi:hypothetical protein
LQDRRHERFRLRVPLYVSLDGSTYQKDVLLESSDVSAGGLSFETSRKLPLEAESQVVVAKLGDLGPYALIRARVAHREHNAATHRYTVGLQFTEFVGVTPDELIARIETWRARPR